jgi:hypothetical protein
VRHSGVVPVTSRLLPVTAFAAACSRHHAPRQLVMAARAAGHAGRAFDSDLRVRRRATACTLGKGQFAIDVRIHPVANGLVKAVHVDVGDVAGLADGPGRGNGCGGVAVRLLAARLVQRGSYESGPLRCHLRVDHFSCISVGATARGASVRLTAPKWRTIKTLSMCGP